MMRRGVEAGADLREVRAFTKQRRCNCLCASVSRSRTRPCRTTAQPTLRRIRRRTRCGAACSASPWWKARTCHRPAMETFTSAFASGIRSTRARLIHFFEKTFQASLLSLSLSVCSECFSFQLFFPSRCLSVTHLHLGSLGHGRGSSLGWASLPLTSQCVADAGLHCLHLHTQHALFIYLYSLASPLMIVRCTCLVLSCHFFVKHSAFLSTCLFVKQSWF